MTVPFPETIRRDDPRYPSVLSRRFGGSAPAEITLLGNADLLRMPKTALFASVKTPGSAILRTYDQAARWRDEGRCVISGFHSPIEKECLRLLLRGKPPLIVCPARGLPQRVPLELRKPLEEGNLLILSAFPARESRATAALAHRRNEIVAALANEIWCAHVEPEGRLSKLTAPLG